MLLVRLSRFDEPIVRRIDEVGATMLRERVGYRAACWLCFERWLEREVEPNEGARPSLEATRRPSPLGRKNVGDRRFQQQSSPR